jgi:hypothetical protein
MLQALILLHRKVYKWFGSGAHHSPYAIFKTHSRQHHGGKDIGFMRAAGTRMAGEFIAFLRWLRMKAAIDSTIASPQFVSLKVAQDLVSILKKEGLWHILFKLVRAVYPILRILRLADQKVPGMDKLNFYVRKGDEILAEGGRGAKDLNDITDRKLNDVFSSINSYLACDEVHDDEEESDQDDFDENEAEENEEDDPSETFHTLSDQVKNAWDARRKRLVSDYSITGWMLSPVKEIMVDANDNHDGSHRTAVERLVVKLLLPESGYETSEKWEEAKGSLLEQFWHEFECFHSKTDMFADRGPIWNSSDLDKDASHVWHKKNSLRFTHVLGKVACRVCSKILGIGSAERAWGDVKHLKTDKRSHLSGDSIKMQATFFGAYCSEKAAMKQLNRNRYALDDSGKDQFWNEDDFQDLGLTKYGIDVEEITQRKKPSKIFRAWLEDWEKEILTTNDPVNEAKLLQKYGGMVWHDPDTKCNFTAHPDQMYFNKKRGDKGYCVFGVKETYNHQDPQDDQWDPWALTDDLYEEIAEYNSRTNPQAHILIVTKKKEKPISDDDSSNGSSNGSSSNLPMETNGSLHGGS